MLDFLYQWIKTYFKGEDFMKKFLLFLFVLLSFSIFADKMTTDGKPHFDKNNRKKN